MNLKLYIDVKNRKLVESEASVTPVNLPDFFREDSTTLQIMLLEEQDDIVTPQAKVDITNMTMQVAIGDQSTYLAYQGTWTKDVAASTFTAELDLNTTEMVSAFTASNDEAISSIFEVEIQESGLISTVLQESITLTPDIIKNTQIAPSAIQAPSALATSMDGILKDSTTVEFEKNADEIRAHLVGMKPPNDALVAGSFLQVNSTADGFDQVASTQGSISIDNLTDVDTTTATPTSGDLLKWDGTNWTPTAHSAPSHTHTISEITDIDTSAVTDGNVLKYNATSGNWEPAADDTGGAAGATSLIGLSDVSSSMAPSVGEFLSFDGTEWANSSAPQPSSLNEIGDVDTATNSPTDGQVLGWDDSTSTWVPRPSGGTLDLDDIQDVDTTGASTGEVLKYDGTNWVAASERSLDIDDLTNVDTSSTGHVPTDGQVLTWDSGMSHWMPKVIGGAPTSVNYSPTEVATGFWQMEFQVAMSGPSFQRVDDINGAISIALDSIVAGASVSLILRSVMEDTDTSDPQITFPITWPSDWDWISLRPDAIGIAQTMVVAISCTDSTTGGIIAGAAPVHIGTDMNPVLALNIDETTVNLP